MISSLPVVAALANGLLIGLIPLLIDGLKPAINSRLEKPDERVEWFGRLFYLTWLPAMPLAGWLLDVGSSRDVLLFCGLIPLIVGVAWLALARSIVSLLSNAVFISVAYSFVTTATIRWMTVAFFPDYIDYQPPMNIAALNLGFVAVGTGAMVGPWLVAAIERWFGVRQGLLYLSVALLAPALLTALCEKEFFPLHPPSTSSWEFIFAHPHLAMMFVVIFIYFALENCLEYWPEKYLKEIGYEGRGFQIGVHVFWLIFVATRGAAAWWLYEHPGHGFVLTLILFGVSALILGNLAGGFEFGSGSLGFWLLGACYGPLLPGLLGITLDLYPASQPLPNSVFGLVLALSGLDTLIARPLMNAFTKDRKARNVMRVPTLLALVAVGVLLVLAFIRI